MKCLLIHLELNCRMANITRILNTMFGMSPEAKTECNIEGWINGRGILYREGMATHKNNRIIFKHMSRTPPEAKTERDLEG